MSESDYDKKLLKNGALGFGATFVFFTSGFVAGVADGFNELSTGVQNSADILSRTTDTLMIAGCLTGLFTAALGTIYYNRKEAKQNNDLDGPQ